MPIIRLAGAAGGGIGAAGQASAAYQQASQSGMAALMRAQEQQQRATLQQIQFQQNQQRLDQQQDFNNARLQQFDEANQIRRQSAGVRGRMPMDGAGVFQMFDQLKGLDYEAATAIHEEAARLMGEDFAGQPMTPEMLEKHPAFPRIATRTSQALRGAMLQQQELNLTQNVAQMERRINQRDSAYMQTPAAAKAWADTLEKVTDEDVTPAQARALLEGFERQALAAIDFEQDKGHLYDMGSKMLAEMDSERLSSVAGLLPDQEMPADAQLREMLSRVLTADTKAQAMDALTEFRMYADPEHAATARKATEQAMRMFDQRQAVMEARRRVEAQGGDPSAFDVPTEDMLPTAAAPNAPAGPISVDEAPRTAEMFGADRYRPREGQEPEQAHIEGLLRDHMGIDLRDSDVPNERIYTAMEALLRREADRLDLWPTKKVFRDTGASTGSRISEQRLDPADPEWETEFLSALVKQFQDADKPADRDWTTEERALLEMAGVVSRHRDERQRLKDADASGSFPEYLRSAGIDMSNPKAVARAHAQYKRLR